MRAVVIALVVALTAGLFTDRPADAAGETAEDDGPVRALRTEDGVMLTVLGGGPGRWHVVTPCYQLATVAEGLPIRGPVDIVIDPGHGGDDEPGASGPNGLEERTINLRVSELLHDELVDRGYRVEMTRYTDVRVAIQARAVLANKLEPTLFVSVHHNGGFPTPFAEPGTEIFHAKANRDARRLAGLVFEELQGAFGEFDVDWVANDTRGVSWRLNDRGSDLYGVLRRTPTLVSVLTEALFLTSGPEAELLAEPETAEIEAQALADAVDRWFETDDAGSGYIDGLVFEGRLGTGGGTEGCVDPDLG